MAGYIPEFVIQGLKDIRQDMHLRWNPTAVLTKAGSFGAIGQINPPEYDPRWELWDKDPDGGEYMVMRLQHMDGRFRPPGQWILDRAEMMNPARWGGDVHKMMEELVEKPELLREAGTKKDSDDLIEAISKAAQWGETPKSAAGISFRGQRLLST